MTTARGIEDYLREEYFQLLPLMEHAYAHAEALLLNFMLPFKDAPQPYDRIEIRKRIKGCESAVATLRRRQEGDTFDLSLSSRYSLLQLHDLVGFRILAFPRTLVERINVDLCKQLANWRADHLVSEDDRTNLFMYKYNGFLPKNDKVAVEIQVMPMLTGLFSDVEHDALYKPKEEYKGISRSLEMRRLRTEVLNALDAFEVAFESYVLDGER